MSRFGETAEQREKAIVSAMARAHTRGMEEVMRSARDEMRDDVLAAGLGQKLANAVRGYSYPAGARTSMAPAAVVFASPGRPGTRSAAAILGQYERGSEITPALANSLAIPSKNVPRIRRGVRMTPAEVEAYYNQKLFRVRLKSGHFGLFLKLVSSRSGKGVRAATRGRVAQGRQVKSVLMFTIVKSVAGKKKLDFGGIVRRWGGRFGELAAANFTIKEGR